MCGMAKADRKDSTDFAAYVLREAKLGYTAPLAGYLRADRPLTADLREFLAELVERAEGKRGKDELRRLEKELIRQQVKGLIEEEGLKPKAAIIEVMESRGRSRSTVYAALRESKMRK